MQQSGERSLRSAFTPSELSSRNPLIAPTTMIELFARTIGAQQVDFNRKKMTWQACH